ncbi:hypothetical protein GCM10009849_17930 [Sinomonas flava]|uniref:Uncharacterized protein n=1 Tax=Sinomonas flava TaxID=496857 RepID=A0ABP5NNV4_9MICC
MPMRPTSLAQRFTPAKRPPMTAGTARMKKTIIEFSTTLFMTIPPVPKASDAISIGLPRPEGK